MKYVTKLQITLDQKRLDLYAGCQTSQRTTDSQHGGESFMISYWSLGGQQILHVL